MIMNIVNPANGEVENEFKTLAIGEIQQRIDASESAIQGWQSTSIAERS